jgi:hypothetical protein
VGGVVYMNALPAPVQHAVVEQPWQDFTAKNRVLWDRHWAGVGEWMERNPAPPPAYSQFHDGEGVYRYGHPRYYDWRARLQGGTNWFDDSQWLPIGSDQIRINGIRDRANNNFLRRYDTVDWTFLVRLVVSFLAAFGLIHLPFVRWRSES